MSTVFVLPSDPTAPFYEYEVPLDGVLFRFRFKFNARDEAWYFDLFNGLTGALLRAGVKVVTGWDLFRLYQGAGRPDGNLLPVSLGDPGLEATSVEELGTELVLTYTGET